MVINNKVNKIYLFFLISVIFLFFISINNNKNFNILTYSVPAYNFKDSDSRVFSYGLNAMNFKSLALTSFSETYGLNEETLIRHIHYSSGHQISWLINKEKFRKIKKELTPEELLDISKKIYNKGYIKKNFIKYLNFLFELNDNTKFKMEYDEFTKDFYINYENMKISFIKHHLQKFDQKNSYLINNTPFLTEDEVIKFIRLQSIDKEIIKKSFNRNYYGSYKLDMSKKNFLKSTVENEKIKLSNINFTPRDIYKLSERYIENNTYFYDAPTLKEKDIKIVNNNKIQNLKITDCKNFQYENGFMLDCKYFPFKISKDGLSLNFF